MNATAIIEQALAGTGLDLVASSAIDRYDAIAPAHVQSRVLLPGARGLVVIGSSGRTLWSRFRESPREGPHPLDGFVAGILDRAEGSFPFAFRRFEPTIYAAIPLDFIALGKLVGLGAPGPFGLLIHPEHGPWWALRAAYLVDAEVDPPKAITSPCEGCAAPCVQGPIEFGDRAARLRCLLGASRYTDEQIEYHYGGSRQLTVDSRQ